MLPSPVTAEAGFCCDLIMDYGYSVTVGFLEGPTLRFSYSSGHVEVTFIHWHREWSHGLLLSLLCGAGCWVMRGGTAGLVAALAVMQHVMADQLGFMGSNLLYPFESARRRGARIAESADPRWNFAVVWCSVVIVLWNVGLHDHLDAGLLQYLFWGCLVPVIAASLVFRRSN
jgi:membrane-bound metal-dependent hydrolase YbcI (DUF457 family)